MIVAKKEKKLSKKLRKKLAEMKAQIKKEPAINDSQCMKHGRPKRGRAVFTESKIDALPDIGRQSDVAHALGIRLASVQQWCELKKNPLPFVRDENGRRMLKRDVVVKWLIATRRFKPKEKN